MANNNDEQVKQILALAGITNEMTEEQIGQLVAMAEERTYSRGRLILQEDSKSRDLYIIVKGRASVLLSLPSECQREEIVYRMRDGQIFGELALVDGSPRSASIQADDEVITYRLPYEKLMALLEENPRIGYYLMRNIAAIISARMRNTNMLWRNSLVW